MKGVIKMQIKKINMIEESDFSKLVQSTYGKPYRFQQQSGCMDRGTFELKIPSEYTSEEEMYDEIPEELNGELMGVKFEKWLERDPKEPIKGDFTDWMIELFWERNFYPDIYTLANDLHSKGLIEAGYYVINIDW